MDSENPDKKAGSAPSVTQGAPGIPDIEKGITEFWEQEGIFQKSLDKTKDSSPYTFYDGPPFATGLPHYGHILASTIKDVIPRYQTMRGHFVRRRWGWDCHGLPIEALVEKKLEISGKKQIEEVGIKTFNETCRSMVLQYVEEWGKMVRRMGRWVDFKNSYKTMDLEYMESVWWAFKQVYDKGLAYEGRKVLLYCPRCETPISNFEVAMDNSYKDVTEESVYVKFRVASGQKIREWTVPENTFLLAWTTTPWTLPGNVALAVGDDIDYVIVKRFSGKWDDSKKAIYDNIVLAKNIFESYKKESGLLPAQEFYFLFPQTPDGCEVVTRPNIDLEIKGKELIGLNYEPLYIVDEVSASDKAHKIYAADFVTTEDGTGIVHTAVVYGEDDYKLGAKEGLPVIPLLDEKGHFNEQAPELIRGQYFKKAEQAIKNDLESRGLLFKREAYTHPYPHCWRCSTALYYNAIPAWFINIQKIKEDLLKTNKDQINWFPGHLKHGRYQKSVEAAPDWNISRNRYWGNPIPVWNCVECGKQKVAGKLEDIIEHAPKAKNKYILLRHGESENYVHNVVSSNIETQSVHDLTPDGVSHAERSAQEMRDKKIDLIYSSDFKRTFHTAEIVAKTLGIPEVATDEHLREINTGEFDGRPIAEYAGSFANRKERFTKRPPGGETMIDVMARSWAFLKDLENKHDGKTILIVSHEDVLWGMEAVMRGWSIDKIVAAKPERGSVFIAPGEFHEAPLVSLPRNDNGEVDLHRPYIDDVVLICECGSEMRRTPEIFDSWVEAGSMPFSEYHYPFDNKEIFESRFPAQFVAEYIAQTRAWFYVMHVISQIVFGRAPFENVVTTGTILAEDGSKMSKSKNNYPDPWLVIEKYGVDTLRFYLMNSVVMQADNLNFSQKDMESVYRKVVLILWNVEQYYKTYAPAAVKPEDENSASVIKKFKPSHVLDRWISAREKELVITVTDALDGYDTVRATRAIAAFVDDLSTWYLRRSRGREDEWFYPVFRATLITTAKIIAPFMPHMAEAIYRDLRLANYPESVHLTDWPAKEELSADEKKLLEDMETARHVASMVLAARKSLNVPVRQPLARMSVMGLKGEPIQLASDIADILLSEVNVKELASIDKDASGIEKSADEKYVLLIDVNLTDELKLEGEVRKLERAIQEKRKEMGMKVGEMARLVYSADDDAAEAGFKAIDVKKTYIAEIRKGSGVSGTFEIEKIV